MKTIALAFSVVVLVALSSNGQILPSTGTAAWTNAVRAKIIAEQQALVTARQEAEARVFSDPRVTNGMPRFESAVDMVKREIRPVPGGAISDYGRLKVQFPANVVDPLTITTPEGRTLSCQASCVVL